jgi:hypothetical protein
MRRHRTISAVTLALATVATTGAAAFVAAGASAGPAAADQVRRVAVTPDRHVMFVGNNWAGTASVIAHKTKKRIKTLNIVPDRAEELRSIYAAPDRLAFYLAVQQGVGEGHDQYVDDMFTTRDGKLLAVSRPSFSDVVWIDLATGRIVAEQQMDGYRTDHMGVSPDGRRLLVSDSTDRSVHEFVMGGKGDPATGRRLRTFASGDTPHENSYTRDGSRILHASIGRVYTPWDYPRIGPINGDVVHDTVKADRWLEVVRTRDFKIGQRWDMGKELAEAGYPGQSSAVRPLALSPDEKVAYLQVSFLHGIVEFRMDRLDPTGGFDYSSGGMREPSYGVVTRVGNLPVSEEVENMPREQYVLDSAHHGIAMNPRGNRICVAGTMSDYATVVSARTLRRGPLLLGGEKPYWVTPSADGRYCYISWAGSDTVSRIGYRSRRIADTTPVGDHPQRVRTGVVRRSYVG